MFKKSRIKLLSLFSHKFHVVVSYLSACVLVFSACTNSNYKIEHAYFNDSISTSASIQLTKKDTTLVKLENENYIQQINLGFYETDSTTYNVFNQIKTVSLADGFKNRSTLLLVNENLDSFRFEAALPEELPKDIIDNKFIFQNEMQELIQDFPTKINRDIICFDNITACFVQW